MRRNKDAPPEKEGISRRQARFEMKPEKSEAKQKFSQQT